MDFLVGNFWRGGQGESISNQLKPGRTLSSKLYLSLIRNGIIWVRLSVPQGITGCRLRNMEKLEEMTNWPELEKKYYMRTFEQCACR